MLRRCDCLPDRLGLGIGEMMTAHETVLKACRWMEASQKCWEMLEAGQEVHSCMGAAQRLWEAW